MVRRLESIKGFDTVTHVILDLTDVSAIDGTTALAVENMLRMIQSHRQNLSFVGIKPGVLKVLDGFGVLKYLGLSTQRISEWMRYVMPIKEAEIIPLLDTRSAISVDTISTFLNVLSQLGRGNHRRGEGEP